MTDHRRVQRALFRMQLDADFAAALRAGDPTAVASTDLDPADLELLTEVDPAALSADRDHARARQLLGNLATEMPRSVRALTAAGGEARLRGFLASPAFHRAIRRDESLPEAFAVWVEAQARGPERALAALEAAMVRARRRLREETRAPRPGQVALAPWCHLVAVPDGTLAWASAITEGCSADPAHRAPDALDPTRNETLLIQADAQPGASGRREVRVERLEPAVAGLLQRAAQPAAVDELVEWARGEGATREACERFLSALAADGVLVRG